MDYGQEKIFLLTQVGFDAADDRGTVTVADFFDDDSDCASAFFAQSAGKEIRAIVQFSGGVVNAALGTLRDGAGGRRVVENRGDRARSQPQMLGDGFESNDLRFLAWLLVLGHDSIESKLFPSTRPGRTLALISDSQPLWQ